MEIFAAEFSQAWLYFMMSADSVSVWKITFLLYRLI